MFSLPIFKKLFNLDNTFAQGIPMAEKRDMHRQLPPYSLHRDIPNIVTCPGIAIISTMIRLICRIVVLVSLFWIGCKSAKMFAISFLL